jgi:hypothetical protein
MTKFEGVVVDIGGARVKIPSGTPIGEFGLCRKTVARKKFPSRRTVRKIGCTRSIGKETKHHEYDIE